jgi:hypothetical protein
LADTGRIRTEGTNTHDEKTIVLSDD